MCSFVRFRYEKGEERFHQSRGKVRKEKMDEGKTHDRDVFKSKITLIAEIIRC